VRVVGSQLPPAPTEFNPWSGLCPSVSFRLSRLTLMDRAARIQGDSPGSSTLRGQRIFPSEYYEDRHTCYVTAPGSAGEVTMSYICYTEYGVG